MVKFWEFGNSTVPLHFINIRFKNSKIETLKPKSNKLLIANFVYPTLISLGLAELWTYLTNLDQILTKSWPILTLQHSGKIVQGLVKYVQSLVKIGRGSVMIGQDQTNLDQTLTDLDPSTFGQDRSRFGQDQSRFGQDQSRFGHDWSWFGQDGLSPSLKCIWNSPCTKLPTSIKFNEGKIECRLYQLSALISIFKYSVC